MDHELYSAAITELGGVTQAAATLGVSRSLPYLIKTERRRLSLRIALRIEEATAGRYRAADLLGLNTAPAKPRKVA
jgi:DNA-binding transcriptional regulator YdaS (Cro superfamily)